MEDIKNRTGSTLSSVMRTAFTGEMMGTSNASKETTRIAKDCCLGIAINLQPEAAKYLLAEDKYGTPQRFLWFNATDPAMSEKMPDSTEFQIRLPTESQPIYLDHNMLADIRKTLWLRASGKEEVVEIDAHIGWLQCKVAAVLVV